MKIFGALVLLGYGAMAFGGWEPFTSAKKGELKTARRGPTGSLLWFGGISGGK